MLTVVEPSFGVPIEGEQRIIKECIIKAINKDPVALNPKTNVAIGVTDSTRQTPNSKILPIVLDELKNFGIKDENVIVIIATGMHRPDNAEEIKRNLGEENLRRVKVVNHNPDDRKSLTCLGKTDLGTQIEVNKIFADADVRITTGTVVPCTLAGWSAGGKTVMPGMSSRNSIIQNHALFVENVRKAKRGALFGLVENNLARQDIDDYAESVGVNLIVNTVQDSNAKILGVYAGHLHETYERALAHAKKAMTVPAPEKADIVVASPGVYTHEVSLFQSASRVLASIETLVKDKGSIILASSCYKGLYEGIEDKEFKKTLLQYRDPDEILELTEKGEIPSFESIITYELVWMMKHFTITAVTHGMSKRELEEIGMAYAPTINKALETSLSHYGNDATVTVVPYASLTYAKTKMNCLN